MTQDNELRHLWTEFVSAERAFVSLRMKLFQRSSELPPLLTQALNHPHERGAALDVIEHLGMEEKKQVFGDLLSLASFAHGLTERCHRILLSMPRQWILDNIEASAMPILRHATSEEYRALFLLYFQLDHGLARRLAEHAAIHPDPEVQDASQDFKDKLSSDRKPHP